MNNKEQKFNLINTVKNNNIEQANSKTKRMINHKPSASYSNTPTIQINFVKMVENTKISRPGTAKRNANSQNNYTEKDKQANILYNYYLIIF